MRNNADAGLSGNGALLDSYNQLDTSIDPSSLTASIEQQTPHNSIASWSSSSSQPIEMRLLLLPSRSFSTASNWLRMNGGKRSPSALTPRLGRSSPLTPRIGRSFSGSDEVQGAANDRTHSFVDSPAVLQPYPYPNRFIRTALTPRLGRSAPSESKWATPIRLIIHQSIAHQFDVFIVTHLKQPKNKFFIFCFIFTSSANWICLAALISLFIIMNQTCLIDFVKYAHFFVCSAFKCDLWFQVEHL